MSALGLLELLGWVLVVTGGVDLVLVNTPLQFGNPLWEFGVASQTVSSLVPLLAGVALLLVVAEGRPHRVRSGVLVALTLGALLTLVALGALAGLSVPPLLELAGVQEGAPEAARRAVLKTFGLGAIGAAFLAVCTTRSLRLFTT